MDMIHWNTNDFYGRLHFCKTVHDGSTKYRAKRVLQGDLNRSNDANPESIFNWGHNAENDRASTIRPGSSFCFKYSVYRDYYERDLCSIYEYEEDILMEKDNILYVNSQGEKKPFWKIEQKLFTDLSLMDTLNKTAVERPKDFSWTFDFFENMQYVKPGHKIQFVDSMKVKIKGSSIVLFGYCQIGVGISPIFYWVSESGMLISVRYGILFMILDGAGKHG
jgi:hypothetical protein